MISSQLKTSAREKWPLIFAERQMAVEQDMDPASCAYNVNLALEITGALDVPRLEQALTAFVNRHAAFRSYYPKEEGGFTHRVLGELSVTLKKENCKGEDVEALIRNANVPFDLQKTPLFRFTLYKTGDESSVLHFNIHHIIIDAASGSIMMDELWRIYNGEELPPLEIDYPDYAAWQDEHPEVDEGKAFFTEMFADGVPENEMPTLPRRPGILPFADVDCVRAIDTARVEAAAKKLGVTTYSLLFASAALTLAKYYGSDDVTLGAAMSGRQLAETAGTIGMFVNTLPVRIKIPEGVNAPDFVKTVAERIKEVKKRQTYPFEKIVPMLAPDRNASRSPVFDMIVNYLRDVDFPAVKGISLRQLPIKRQALAMDLMLEFLREGDKLRIVLSYSRALYQDEVINNLMEQLTAIIFRFVSCFNDGKQEDLRDIAELPDEQRRQILVDFSGERSDENLGKTLVDLFREQEKKTPQNRAVVFGGRVYRYAELNEISDRIASYLALHNKGGAVGILLHRSETMPAAALGVMKSGAAYLPLDPGYPPERLEFMLEDAGVNVVIADEDLKDRIGSYGGAFLYSRDISTLPPGKVPPPPAARDTMILLYTSGTTGNPKGVMLTHANLCNFCTWYRSFFNLSENDNTPAYASFGFDAHMMDMYPALISGACVHIIPEEMRLDLPGLRNYFEANNINVAFITTQLGRQFAESMQSRGLRALSVGGEALVPLPPPGNFTLYNVYGPTECTVLTTTFRVDKLYDRVPIGRAVGNTSLYVVDKNMRLAPVGAAGELCIAGRQVGKGYLNRPDLTSEKFVKNPFSSEEDYVAMYRTGDVVRFLPDGNIDFVGRRDFQVKIRGFRVELTEIEERIRAFPAVKEAAVIAADAPGGGKCAVAYIVGDSPIEVEKLNLFIEEALPPYMVPAATMQLKGIPLNPNGKVDRRKLPAPVFTAENEDAPRLLNNLEKEIFQIASGILGHEGFGLTTSLMRAGLSSLSCIKLAAALDEKFGVSVAVRDIMKNPTPLGIENAIFELLLSGKKSDVKQREKKERYPLSQSQMGLYYDCLKNPFSLIYNVPVCLRLSPGTNVELLRKAVAAIAEAHPALTARLFMNGDEVQQAPGGAVEVSVISAALDDMPAKKSAFLRPFHLFEEPLFRAEICKTETDVFLLLDFHHIIFDGFSLDIFMRELAEAYQGQVLENETFTIFDAAQMEKEKEGGEEYLAAKDFFDRLLKSGEGAAVIPTDEKEGGSSTPESLSVTIEKAALAGGLEAMGITPSSLFLGAVGFVTSRFANTKKPGLAAVSSGRGSSLLQRTMGMFVKTLPLVLEADSLLSAGSYLNSVQDTMYGAIAHEAYPYTLIASEYHYHPQILFAYQGSLLARHEIEGRPLAPENMALDVVKFPIDVSVEEEDGSYRLVIEYDPSRFDELTMQTYAECIAHVAQEFANKSETVLGDLSIASKKHLDAIAGFCTAAETPASPCIHGLFESCVLKTPDALALSAPDGEFSYAQLNSRANSLAHALLEKRVTKGDKIAFILPRKSHVFSAIYGIVKAGCAFIPVDPSYPRERIEHILSDSGAKFIICDGDGGYDNGLDINTLLLHQDSGNPGISVESEDLCYIIYTSGSTGKPKGVKLKHGGIVNYSSPFKRNIECTESIKKSSVYVSVTTVSFDAFLFDIFVPLSNGLRIVMASEKETGNPVLLSRLCERSVVDAISTTPSVIMQYMEIPEMRAVLSKFRTIIIGAEKFPITLFKSLREITNAVIFNSYGPTEATVDCNCKIITEEDSGIVPVGRSESGVIEQIMDADGNPLPPGVTGELWIGGPGVAIGYHGRSELTADRFVTWGGMKFYRSGDLAKWNKEGEVLILGRNDSQIKLRGLRIELGEIENAIAACEGIRRNVIRVKKIRGQDHLCAYYTADREIDPAELREAIGKSLPKYMVPTAYRQLEVMPVTPNGKIDFNALGEPVLMMAGEYKAPVSETEKLICDIFAETLKLERVGAGDNFFELGGTSLLVTRVTVGLMNKGYDITYNDVFQNPTPGSLAVSLKGEQAAVLLETAYDYGKIHALLAANNIGTLAENKSRDLGNICLTGATGFLGIHILKEFIENHNGTAYCIVRGGKVSAETRLKTLLAYYFEDNYGEFFGNRIITLDGDVCTSSLEELLDPYPIDTYINCAANVKHFSKGTDIEDINIGGVKNAVALCRKKGCRLIQISTCSIAGYRIGDKPDKSLVLDEGALYFGQDLSNKYVNSKFIAERIILEAVLEGLDAKIMRVGNLMARSADGEFQVNFNTNSFLGMLKAYNIVGSVPFDILSDEVEFSFVDYTAKAVLLLTTTTRECTVFHPYNNHTVFFRDILSSLEKTGIKIDRCENDKWKAAYSEALKDEAKARYLLSLFAYKSRETLKEIEPIASVNSYTIQALDRLGFTWPIVTDVYLAKFMEAMKTLNYFA